MATYSLYDGTVPHATATLKTLLRLADKLESHASSKSVPVDTLLQARLAPDMLPFTFQVHSACDAAVKLVARVEGFEPPTEGPLAAKHDEQMKSVDDVRARVNAALDIVAKADPAKFAERTDSNVTFGLGPGKSATLKARDYTAGYTIPNMYFHVMTAYSILRNQGVELGKRDYLEPYMSPYLQH